MASLAPGDLVPLIIDKPAAGGRMLARREGQVVLVSGAIPGEEVVARVERVAKGLAYASLETVTVLSPDRRDPGVDPVCGGCLYSHITYARQLAIKGEIIRDAFIRIGRIPIAAPVAVRGSRSEEGYRMRARLHIRGGRIGFFREGTHELCDARITRQLLPSSCDVLERTALALGTAGDLAGEIELSENLDATARVIHVEAASALPQRTVAALAALDDVTGVTSGRPFATDDVRVIAGDPHVADEMTLGHVSVRLQRHVLSFFQGNRYLVQDLAIHVTDLIPRSANIVDLYAGTGLFAVAAAAARDAHVVAVEGDRVAAKDLDANAAGARGAIEAVHQSVEAFTSRMRPAPDVLIVDPPRTGLSREALEGAVRMRGEAVVYVSCDVATLARDARRLLDAGYTLRQVNGFDLFPNTPHVEVVAVFDCAD